MSASGTARPTFDVSAIDRRQLEQLVMLQHRTIDLMIAANNALGSRLPRPTPEQAAVLEQWSEAINALFSAVDAETMALLAPQAGGPAQRPN